MGTTGGDREKLLADVQAAGIRAVIAPQMGKQARPAVQSLPSSFCTYQQQGLRLRSHQGLIWLLCYQNCKLGHSVVL